MAYPRKYKNRYTTAVSMEQTEKDIMAPLGIEHPDAHRIGLHVLIEQRINDSDPRITPEILEKFAELKRALYSDIKEYIRLQDAAQTTLQNIKSSVEKKEELIRVYDKGEEAYVHITRAQLDANPDWYILSNGGAP